MTLKNDERAERSFRRLWIARPLPEFLRTEAVGGALLAAAALAALIVANSLLDSAYFDLWAADLTIGIGEASVSHDLRGWVNEGLMAFFFLVVGLEIKRELVAGELRHRRLAVLPIMAAVGGMALPALIYLAVNADGGESHGWGIPMPTDVAFALGLLAVLGSRVPPALKTFVLTLAVTDDILTILLIPIFYSSDVDPMALGAAALLVLAGLALLRLNVQFMAVWAFLGICLWLALDGGGVAPTLAGVLLAFLIPGRLGDDAPVLHEVTPSLGPRVESAIHPWSSLMIVPLFAFANLGVDLDPAHVDEQLTGPVGLGILLARIIGKVVGITLGSWLIIALGIGVLHPSLRLSHIVGAAALAAVGFTVSLLITELAFADGSDRDAAKVALLAASLVGAALGLAILSFVLPQQPRELERGD